MNLTKLALAATFAFGSAGIALAQQTPRLDDLDAEWINATQVLIDFEYDGGACEAVGLAEVGALTDGVLAVTFPTTATAEICTQQIVEIDVKYAINAPEGATHVAVTLLATDGSIKATGTERIERD